MLQQQFQLLKGKRDEYKKKYESLTRRSDIVQQPTQDLFDDEDLLGTQTVLRSQTMTNLRPPAPKPQNNSAATSSRLLVQDEPKQQEKQATTLSTSSFIRQTSPLMNRRRTSTSDQDGVGSPKPVAAADIPKIDLSQDDDTNTTTERSKNVFDKVKSLKRKADTEATSPVPAKRARIQEKKAQDIFVEDDKEEEDSAVTIDIFAPTRNTDPLEAPKIQYTPVEDYYVPGLGNETMEATKNMLQNMYPVHFKETKLKVVHEHNPKEPRKELLQGKKRKPRKLDTPVKPAPTTKDKETPATTTTAKATTTSKKDVSKQPGDAKKDPTIIPALQPQPVAARLTEQITIASSQEVRETMEINKPIIDSPVLFEKSDDAHSEEYVDLTQERAAPAVAKRSGPVFNHPQEEKKTPKITIIKKTSNNTASTSNNDVGYKYKEVVRNKAERAKLKAFDCEQCRSFYDAMSDMGLPEENRRRLVNACSRHRARFEPHDTPPNFWDMGFIEASEAPRQAQDEEDKAGE